MAINIPARLRDEDFVTCLVEAVSRPRLRNGPRTLLRRALRTDGRRRRPARSLQGSMILSSSLTCNVMATLFPGSGRPAGLAVAFDSSPVADQGAGMAVPR